MSSEFRVSRSLDIAAAPAQILPLLADLRQWRHWSPWENLDPDMRRTYGGAESGVGQTYAWQGNRKAGSGRMEILETSDEHVGIDLRFTAPMRAQNRTDFTLTPAGETTRVEWAMSGRQNLVMRLMSVVMPMDKLVGSDFEKGLRQLKVLAEQGSTSA